MNTNFTPEEVQKLVRALQLSARILEYIGFDQWEREVCEKDLDEIDVIMSELGIDPEESPHDEGSRTEDIAVVDPSDGDDEDDEEDEYGDDEYGDGTPKFDSQEFYNFILCFVWTDQKGQRYHLTEMNTSHIFNSLKMLYNHTAKLHGKPTVWFFHEYSGGYQYIKRHIIRTLKVMLAFVYMIESRQDLNDRYSEPYAFIVEQLFGICPEYRDLVKKNRLPGAMPRLSAEDEAAFEKILALGYKDD